MKIVIAAPHWPYPAHVLGANTTLFELTRGIGVQPGVTTAFLKVNRQEDDPPDENARVGLDSLSRSGVTILPPATIPLSKKARFSLSPRRRYIPDSFHGKYIADALANYRPDVIVVPLSEWLTAACSTVPCLRVAYYGNPDPKVFFYRTIYDARVERSTLKLVKAYVNRILLERAHMEIAKRYDLWADVSANDAEYYRRKGHPCAFYVGIAWTDQIGSGWRERREALERTTPPIKIIANVGSLNATANRYGIEYLAREFAPRLCEALRPSGFTLDLIGRGSPPVHLSRELNKPWIRLRGFVDDIDGEILSSPIFVCLNNATPYKVSHTRYLHAWSLGACIVAHRDVALSMPEIKHNENALLGSNAAEIAELCAHAIRSPADRRRIGENGWRTYDTLFRGYQIGAEIVARINSHKSAKAS